MLLASYIRQRIRNNMATCNVGQLVATNKVSLQDMNAVPCFQHVDERATNACLYACKPKRERSPNRVSAAYLRYVVQKSISGSADLLSRVKPAASGPKSTDMSTAAMLMYEKAKLERMTEDSRDTCASHMGHHKIR